MIGKHSNAVSFLTCNYLPVGYLLTLVVGPLKLLVHAEVECKIICFGENACDN